MERIQKFGWLMIVVGGGLLIIALFGFFVQDERITLSDVLTAATVFLAAFFYWLVWGKPNLKKEKLWLCIGPLFLVRFVVLFVHKVVPNATIELIGDFSAALALVSLGYFYVANR